MWVPIVYTSPGMYLKSRPIILGTAKAAAVLVAGTVAVFLNYASDAQRQARTGRQRPGPALCP